MSGGGGHRPVEGGARVTDGARRGANGDEVTGGNDGTFRISAWAMPALHAGYAAAGAPHVADVIASGRERFATWADGAAGDQMSFDDLAREVAERLSDVYGPDVALWPPLAAYVDASQQDEMLAVLSRGWPPRLYRCGGGRGATSDCSE